MSALQRMIRVYDKTMIGSNQRRYYENSGYYNFGYWTAQTRSQRDASEALVDRLVARIERRGGRILDVACGLGASTRRLMQRYEAQDITGINISETQVAHARERAPGCAFHVMDATALKFPDAHFDAVICVEAAFHFDTRDAFLREALRVLKPGGSLVLSDILFFPIARLLAKSSQLPPANFVPDVARYRERFAAAGFVAIEVEDATRPCLDGFRANLAGWPAAEHRAGRMKLAKSVLASAFCRLLAGYFGLTCKTYLLTSAQRPA